MDTITLKQSVSRIIKDLGLASVRPDWSGCDAVWKALEEMANEGATVVVKIDGQRTSPDDNGRYTVLVSGGPLGSEDFFRTDTHVLEEGLSKAILYYAEKCWK
jgi:hypothetical protein